MKFAKLNQLAVVAALVSASTGVMATCSDQPYMGSVCYTAANYCPSPYYAPAQGQIVAVSSNSALFSLLGCTFGGNCQTTFAYPDLRGRAAVGSGQGPALSNVALGQARGAETVTLVQSNLPAAAPTTVNIAVNTTPSSQTSPASGNAYLGASPAAGPGQATIWSNTSSTPVNLAGVTVTGGSSGGQSAPVYTIPPELGMTACIAVQGLYPSRP